MMMMMVVVVVVVVGGIDIQISLAVFPTGVESAGGSNNRFGERPEDSSI